MMKMQHANRLADSREVRVLGVIPDLAHAGGAERMAIDLTRGLLDLDVDARLLNLFPRSDCDLAEYAERLNIDVIYGRKRDGFDPVVYADFLKAAGAQRANIIHTHLYVLRYLFPLLTLSRRRGVHSIHSEPQWDGRKHLGAIHRFLFRSGRSVPVAVGPGLGSAIASFYGLDQVTEIFNGIDTKRFTSITRQQRHAIRAALRVEDETCLIVCVGRLVPLKRPLESFEIFLRAARAARRPAVLAFIGDGELRDSLEHEVATARGNGSVRLLGRRSDMPQLFAAADLSLSLSAYEGAPLSLLEAMASGLPIVATDVGAVGNMLTRDAGVLIDPQSIDTAVTKLAQLIDNPEDRRRLGALARSRASAFDIETMAKGYLACYRGLLS